MPTIKVINLRDGSESTVECQSGDVIYDACSESNVDLPSGCLAGSCGACRIQVLDGTEGNLQSPRTIERNTIEAVSEMVEGDEPVRLSCRARVNGDVTIKVPN